VAGRKQETPRSGFTTVNGLQLHHLEWGPTDGPPLVLLHGHRAHSYIWSRAAPYLAPPYHLLAPDFRGHGDSAWSEEGYGTSRYAADVAGWTEAHGLERFALMGHSAGGRVAVAYAAAHPDRVERLVVVDIGPDAIPTRPFDPALAALPQRTFADLSQTVALLRDRYPAIGTAYLRRLARWSVRPTPDGGLTWKWDKRVRGNPSPREDFWNDLRALRCPTLIVRGGQHGYLSAESAARMQAAVPDCRVITIARAGHTLAEERPAVFATAVRAFLDAPASVSPREPATAGAR
jgi:esterase